MGWFPLPFDPSLYEDYAVAVHDKSRRRGLLFSHEGGPTLLLLLALNMKRSIAEEGLDILELCLMSSPRRLSSA